MFADLNRVVTEGSRGLGKRVERQDDGSRTDLLGRFFKQLAFLGTLLFCHLKHVCEKLLFRLQLAYLQPHHHHQP